MIKPIIKLSNINKSYKTGETYFHALKDVSLEIYQGEFVAIMGQSGSGKSTLMNILGCLDKATSGTYFLEGEDVSLFSSDKLASLRSRSFGFIFQRYNLLATSNAGENVELPGIYAGFDKEERLTRSKELLDKLGLDGRYESYPNQMSGGQQQRVAICRALMNNPPIILADEPTGALDSKSGIEVMHLLQKLNQEEGRTIIVITHDEKVASYAQRILHIYDGKITKEETNQKFDINALVSRKFNQGTSIRSSIGEISDAVKTAFKSLHANIFRTALTLLGIIIGVASVVTMLAIGNGSKESVLEQISAMGTNLLSIRPGVMGFRGSGDVVSMIYSDAEALREIDNVIASVPERSGSYSVKYRSIDYSTTINAVNQEFPLARDWTIEKGSFFDKRDVSNRAAVVVLGKTVANTLFPEESNYIGRYILIKNIPFEVIGTMTEKGAAPWGGDQDDAVYIPISTGLNRLFGKDYLRGITVKVRDVNQIEKTQDDITSLLKERHRTEDFHIRNTASIISTATEMQNTLTILLGAVAAISLLVGGIGVMNIMLVSVTERTREIGVRMATGARMKDIMLQFNTEATVVCIVGGLLGIILGISIGLIVKALGTPVAFTITPALLAFSCSLLTGLVFGYLPAKKAAKLDPVVALSSE